MRYLIVIEISHHTLTISPLRRIVQAYLASGVGLGEEEGIGVA